MDKELHYLTYDSDEIWKEMNSAYIDAGGDVLYPGDEKEMLLRGVQAIIMQVFAGVDAAIRMDTLRYAVGEYLDIYGEKRNCLRIPAASATSTVEIKFKATGVQRVLEAGTALTADGEKIYLLAAPVFQTGLEQTVQAEIVARETGRAGNGLRNNTQMQFLTPYSSVISVFTKRDASGGQDAEDDETYRERIRTFGLSAITTGPAVQYESAAMAVSSEIVDAKAINGGAGKVKIYILPASDVGKEALLKSVQDALSAKTVRPLTDNVEVLEATKKEYTIKLQYAQEEGSDIAEALRSVISEYQKWQDTKIGRAFNPDRLMAMAYQAGAMRVTWGAESKFNGSGPIQYTAIEDTEYCKGTISLEVAGS